MSSHVVDQVFVAEWAGFKACRAGRDLARSWPACRGDLDVGVRVVAGDSGLAAGVDALHDLLGLVGVMEGAMRVVVQCMRPQVVSAARRRSGPCRSFDEAFVDALSSAAIAVGAVAEQSPSWPMWALRKQLSRELERLDSQVELDPIDEFIEFAGAVESDRCRLLPDAVEAGCLGRSDAQVVFATRLLGYSTDEVAAALGVPTSTLRKRRSRAEHALRAFAA